MFACFKTDYYFRFLLETKKKREFIRSCNHRAFGKVDRQAECERREKLPRHQCNITISNMILFENILYYLLRMEYICKTTDQNHSEVHPRLVWVLFY